jgi:hypothetical protein
VSSDIGGPFAATGELVAGFWFANRRAMASAVAFRRERGNKRCERKLCDTAGRALPVLAYICQNRMKSSRKRAS